MNGWWFMLVQPIQEMLFSKGILIRKTASKGAYTTQHQSHHICIVSVDTVFVKPHLHKVIVIYCIVSNKSLILIFDKIISCNLGKTYVPC